MQDAYVYLLLSLVKHQRAYCFHKSWSCIFRRVVWNWRYPHFHDEGSKGAIQLCENRPLMPFEMLHSFLVGQQLPVKKTTNPSQVKFFWFNVDLFMCQMSVKTDVQRAESSMKFCLECWIHYTETMWLKTVNKQTRKHVEKGFTLNFWRLVDSSVILDRKSVV